jgi:hypothetical protein
LQCDEILLAPESVASILERETQFAIQTWFELVEQDAELACIPLTREERTEHLPKLFQDLIRRLRLNSGLPALISLAAREHGEIRCGQGYTAAMMVDEARFLEVRIFTALQRNRCRMDRRQVLADIVASATLARVKKEMALPRVAASAREGLPVGAKQRTQ